MRHFTSTFFATSLLCVAPIYLAAQGVAPEVNPRSIEPGRLYFVAYEEVMVAEQLEKKGDFSGAKKRYTEAGRLFTQIKQFHPNFKPEVVARRIALTESAITALAAGAKKQQDAKKAAVAGLLNESSAPDELAQGKEAPPRVNPSSSATIETAQESEKLRWQLANEKKQRELAEAQLERVNPVKDRFDEMKRELLRLQIEQKAVTRAPSNARAEKIQADAALLMAQTKVKAQSEQLAELKKARDDHKSISDQLIASQIKRIDQLEKELEETKAAEGQRQLQLAALQKRLDESNLLLKEVTLERDSLKTERDNFASMLEMNDPRKDEKLLEEKIKLIEELARAKEKIVHLEKSQDTQQVDLKMAKEELALVKTRLQQVQEENIDHSKRVSELSTKLRYTEDRLKQLESQPTQDPVMVEELSLLREVAKKHKQALAAREMGIQRLVSAAERLKIEDPQFIDIVSVLQGKPIELTDEEKAVIAQEKEFRPINKHEEELNGQGYADPKTRVAAHKANQDEIAAYDRSARRAYAKGQYDLAAGFYQSLLEDLHPMHFESSCNLGVILLKTAKASEAVEHFRNALTMREDHPFPHFMLGMGLYYENKNAEAESALREGLKLDPANVNAYVYLGLIASRSGKNAEAIMEFEKAVQLQPDHAVALFNLAKLEALAGKIENARVHYDSAIEHGALPDDELAAKLKPQS